MLCKKPRIQRDDIDKRLAQMYSQQKTVNTDNLKRIEPDRVWEIMSLVGQTNIANIQAKHKPLPRKSDIAG